MLKKRSFISNKEDKEMYLCLLQSRDCLNFEPGFTTLGLQMLALIFPWIVQKILSSLVPHLIFFFSWKQLLTLGHFIIQAFGKHQMIKNLVLSKVTFLLLSHSFFPKCQDVQARGYMWNKKDRIWVAGGSMPWIGCRTKGLSRGFTQTPTTLFAGTGVQVLRFWTGSNLSNYVPSP